MKRYFWDIDTDKSNPKQHPEYYMTRILEVGNRKAVDWLFRVFR